MMHDTIRGAFLAPLLASSLACGLGAQVQLASVFSDHMVLQRDKPIAVWGTAAAGEAVVVTMHGLSAKGAADENGEWLVHLDAHAAGGPFELTVRATTEVTLRDVLVGEVWICSGQSNMQWPMQRFADTREAMAKAADDQLRILHIPHVANRKPQKSAQATWTHAGPDTLSNFSAVGYGFGRHLRETVGVAIGLVHSSWGGTRAEAWTRESTLQQHAVLQPILKRWQQTYARYPKAKAKYDRALADWKSKAATARAAGEKPPRRPGAPLDPDHRHAPGRLHYGMIEPLVPMTFRGVIWYQGDANAGRAYQYRTLFPALIRDWRDTFGQGQFPFLFVQLAAFEDKRGHPHAWAELREAQTMTLAVPNTGMACTIDIGQKNNIHPPHKLEVGRRLALLARAGTYGHDVVSSGPMLSHYSLEGARIRLHFDHVGSGLVQKGEALHGFEIAAADGKFDAAEASLDGNTVVVRGSMAVPRHVRYAWRHWPQVSLFNGEGLPAPPFRTDSLKGVTDGAR